MKPLDGKIAIVTGAGRLRGIGRAAACALADLGADVVITGTGRDARTFPDDEKACGWRDIGSTAEQVRERGRRALPLVADATSNDDAERVIAAALSEFGRLDVLVNNAALSRGADRVPLTDLSEDLWSKVLGVKLTGAFLMTRAAVPAMTAHRDGGAIINLSSIAGKRGFANAAAYCAANAGIQGFTQAMSLELAPHRIRVNAVCPGLTDTSRMDALGRGDGWSRHIREAIPLERAASDEEVGRLIAWLATPDASFITGQSININGGSFPW